MLHYWPVHTLTLPNSDLFANWMLSKLLNIQDLLLTHPFDRNFNRYNLFFFLDLTNAVTRVKAQQTSDGKEHKQRKVQL